MVSFRKYGVAARVEFVFLVISSLEPGETVQTRLVSILGASCPRTLDSSRRGAA